MIYKNLIKHKNNEGKTFFARNKKVRLKNGYIVVKECFKKNNISYVQRLLSKDTIMSHLRVGLAK